MLLFRNNDFCCCLLDEYAENIFNSFYKGGKETHDIIIKFCRLVKYRGR